MQNGSGREQCEGGFSGWDAVSKAGRQEGRDAAAQFEGCVMQRLGTPAAVYEPFPEFAAGAVLVVGAQQAERYIKICDRPCFNASALALPNNRVKKNHP